jgi:hypothetical protein
MPTRGPSIPSLSDRPLAQFVSTIDTGCKPIGTGKHEAIEIAKNKPLWRFSLQHIELVAEHQDLRLERNA